jgi:phosphatidate cytidylyltransferase
MVLPLVERPLSGLALRVASALVLGPIVLAAIYFGGWWFSALLAVAAVAMAREWLQMTIPDAASRARYAVLVYAGICGPLLVYLFAGLWFAGAVLAFCSVLGCLLFVWTRQPDPAWAATGIFWAGLPVIAVAWLRLEGGYPLLTVIWLTATVWACDIGAYFFGRAIGGPKLAPKMSPNKTWAGLLGGMASGAVVGIAVALFSGLASALILALAGAILAAISQAGDLAESSVKRNFGVKDSGNLIPGHGGIFDRVDGLLFVFPVGLALAMFRQGSIFPWQ